ncbi:hypothetical protein [Pseudochryseolinea flava]|uniref:Uncharacterized protein n=1 Tax=Pseudochryseolinea flava TaxID=2059302 RepID=A0A364Y4E0_9BACT|nr:hypothetical protein [Pseudochryseolinea flava]RAW00901.1 hypothetical protein DQQ10_11705 [Pseudochryseolinea flava]
MYLVFSDFTSIIDTVVSSTWMFFSYLAVLIAVAITFTVYKPFRTPWMNYILPSLFSIAFLFSLIYLTRGPYGRAVDFIDVASNGKQLALIETHEVGDGDGGTTTLYRLYVLDLKTGNRLVRQVQSYAQIICMTDHLIAIAEPQGVTGYNIFTGDEEKLWSKESGFEKYPELSSGISQLSYVTIDEHDTALLAITAMDGKRNHYDLSEEKLIPGDHPRRSHHRYETTAVLENGDYYYFKDENGEIGRMTVDRKGQSKAYQETFLLPRIVFFDESDDVIIVRHFETLGKKNAIFTAVDLELNKLWELKQNDLIGADADDGNARVGIHYKLNERIIITIGSWVISVNAKNGAVYWKKPL